MKIVNNKYNDKVITFTIMYIGTCSILVLCTEHQLKCNWQTSKHAVRVFTFHHLLYLNTLYLNTPKYKRIY